MPPVALNQHSDRPDHIDRKCGTWTEHADINGRQLKGAAAGGDDLYAFGTRQTRVFHIWEFNMDISGSGGPAWQVDGPNTWAIRVRILTINQMSGIERVWICKADASGVSLGTLGTWSGSTSGTGVKTLNVLNVASWLPANPFEHFYVVLGARAGSSGFPSISIRNDQDNDCWISPVPQGIVPLRRRIEGY